MSVTAQTGRVRGHFQCSVPLGAMSRALQACGADLIGKNVQLETERGGSAAPTPRPLWPIELVAYPCSALVLANLLRQPTSLASDKSLAWLHVPKATFHRIADDEGAARLSDLTLTPGAGDGDDVLADLEDCLRRALRLPIGIQGPVVDDLVNALLLHIACAYGGMCGEAGQAAGGLAPWQLRKSKALIETHLAEPLSIGQLAEVCGLSPGHFSRQFAHCTGMPPRRWIMRRRIEVACEKLVSTNVSLADLAQSCGFADQSHFTRVFATVTGEAPGRWRRERRARQHTGLGGASLSKLDDYEGGELSAVA